MSEQFMRTELLLGREAMEILKNTRVAVFGIGGVGGYTVEALVRSGVGALDLVDRDQVSVSNLNRQLIATTETIGKDKVDVMCERALTINPEIKIHTKKCFFLPETADEFDFTQYDYVVDAVDTVTAKIALVLKAQEEGVPIISSMGAGNKLDPTKFAVADIYETRVCPLAKVMRRELKKRGVKQLKVVYSTEEPVRPSVPAGNEENLRKDTPGSVAFVPSVAGMILAGEVIRDLTGHAAPSAGGKAPQPEEKIDRNGEGHGR